MNIRFTISLGISAALTLFFVFPWITLTGEELYLKTTVIRGNGTTRLLYLATTMFAGSMAFFAFNFMLTKKWFAFNNRWLKVIINIGLNIVLVIFITFVFTSLSTRLFDLQHTFVAFAFSRNLIAALIILLITYVLEIIEQSNHDRIQLLLLQKENAEAELARLKNQIDPHFLFNCFNSLTGVIRSSPKEAVLFVNHLSETFRYALDHHRHNMVTVKEELDFLNSYLYLMKIRFGQGLRVTIDVDTSVHNKKIPHFGLQLVVENAIKHNIVSEQKPLVIHIYAHRKNITVTNNLQLKKTFRQGYGIGLSSLSRHYELLAEVRVEVQKTEHEFTISLPVI
jgi:two-component system LytT family sensor kinase